ncbi:hypothetical protein [Iodobacter ciconiae]|uniref:Uncharacterized protein n=1 Tax=Iodobacter ciconiae TaxID=2496266 RepID=A0A3S8ZU43_9NEIS|nr:hypothetical protein [Iodobacter ciconiae]AZN36964.1 hypothetical protein EJO50_11000 [Iodobacter ciconiae]
MVWAEIDWLHIGDDFAYIALQAVEAGRSDAYRDSAYFMLGDDIQFEFVEYTSKLPVQRNGYAS